MASRLLTSFPAVCSFPRQPQQLNHISNRSKFHRFNVFHATQSHCEAVATKNISISGQEVEIVRRSANYHPSIWDYDYVQSLTSDYLDNESYKERARKLMEEVRKLLDNVVDPLEKLELVDNLQRLGLSYKFEDEIKKILKDISADFSSVKDNLYGTAVGFRLLRQHGYNVNQVVFSGFLDEVGNFKASLSKDWKGMLNLYEASYLLMEGERILENARAFVAKHLTECLNQNNNEYILTLVEHAMEFPLHWRLPRMEARWFIDVYKKKQDKIPMFLELAILEFNLTQAVHQDDLKYAARWWKDLGLVEGLSFARDRVVENFLWSVGMMSRPQFGKARRVQTKVNALITSIDDVYDIYGTLDELELFTKAVERWDINAIQSLPNYMKICFHALYNSINEMAFDTLKEQDVDVIPLLKKLWTNLCKAYLLEARWYHSGYTPTLKEYIENAWISISGSVLLAHSYLITDPITKEGLQGIEEYDPNIDEVKRGDTPKSIQCHMHESGASEEEAREHIRKLIDETWRKMNKDRITKSPFSESFIEIAQNLARVAQFIYQYGDGHGIEDGVTKDRVLSLFIHPIPLPK
ncbi:hypothetical protein CCACVL1_26939 [Corchorus capsularis]|uniref:Uncharacterized protein n=1 Tax=Corchorus capsularis TaxID=210143 RepID=A0A1R3GCS7_COCAP|nr:hypothetical protein CCACVL1_26939 [Corchorus capsularis]